MIDLTAALATASEARVRADACTSSPAPWTYHLDDRVTITDADGLCVVHMDFGIADSVDGEFIAAARTDVPKLADVVEQLVSRVQALETAASAVHHDLLDDAVSEEQYQATLGRLFNLVQDVPVATAACVEPLLFEWWTADGAANDYLDDDTAVVTHETSAALFGRVYRAQDALRQWCAEQLHAALVDTAAEREALS